MLKKILLTIGLLVGSAFAQGGAASGEVRFPNGQTVPYANVLVCNTPANGVPCSNKASLFTDATLSTPIFNPIVLQPINFGAWSFGAAQGNYVIQVSGPGYNTASFPVTFGIPSGTSIVNLTVTGTLTLSGAQITGGTYTSPIITGSPTYGGLVNSCGGTNPCNNSVFSKVLFVTGSIALAAGTQTITGINPGFTGAAAYTSYCVDITTPANACKAVAVSGSSVTLTGTGTDVVSYLLIGQSN